MKFKSTWIFAALALALGAYIYLVEIKKAQNDEATKEANERIINAESDKVKAVELVNPKGKIKLEKDDKGAWQITEPVHDLADDYGVSSLLTSATTEKYDEVVAEGDADLKPFELDKPKMSMALTLKDGSVKKVSFGSEGAIRGKIYLQRDAEKKVLYGNSALKNQVDKSLKDLRDKKIFRKTSSDISQISLKYHKKDGDFKIVLDKKKSEWFMAGSDSEKSDSETVQGLLTAIENLRANDFASEKSDDASEMKQFGLSDPEIIIQLAGEGAKSLETLKFSPKKDNNVYVSIGSTKTVYQIFASSSEQFVHKADDFRDKRSAFLFNKDDIGEIILKTGLVDVDLLKKGENWDLAQPNPQKQVSQIQVTTFIDKLTTLKVSEFLDGEKPQGLNPPKGSVILMDKSGKSLFTMRWGEGTKSKKSYFVQPNKSKDVYGVEKSLVDSFPGQTMIETKTPASSSPAPEKKKP